MTFLKSFDGDVGCLSPAGVVRFRFDPLRRANRSGRLGSRSSLTGVVRECPLKISYGAGAPWEIFRTEPSHPCMALAALPPTNPWSRTNKRGLCPNERPSAREGVLPSGLPYAMDGRGIPEPPTVKRNRPPLGSGAEPYPPLQCLRLNRGNRHGVDDVVHRATA